MKKYLKQRTLLCSFATLASLNLLASDLERTVDALIKEVKNPASQSAQIQRKVAAIQKEMASASVDVKHRVNIGLAEVLFHMQNVGGAKKCYDSVPQNVKDDPKNRRLLMLLGSVLGESEGKPMLEKFFRDVKKPLLPGNEEKALFEAAARRYIDFCMLENPSKAQEMLRLLADLDGSPSAKRLLVYELAKMRNDAQEKLKQEGKKPNAKELKKILDDLKEMRKIEDDNLAQLYVEALRTSVILEDKEMFDSCLRSAAYYVFNFDYFLRNNANGAQAIVFARNKTGGSKVTMDSATFKKQKEDLISEFSPYSGLYYYHAMFEKQIGDKAIAAGKKDDALKAYSNALKALMVINSSYLMSNYNDKGMMVFDEIVYKMDKQLNKKVKYEYKVKDYYVALITEISPLLKINDYRSIEPKVLAAVRRSKSNPASMFKMADILIKLCWNNMPNRESQMVAFAQALNEMYPTFNEDGIDPTSYLQDVFNLLIAKATLQTPEPLAYATIAGHSFIKHSKDDAKSLTVATRIADVTYNLAFQKSQEAVTKKNQVLAEQSKEEFLKAGEAYEQLISRWPNEGKLADVYYRAAFAFRNGGQLDKSTKYFMEYAKNETNPEKAQLRIDSLFTVGDALMKSKEVGAGTQCLEVFTLLYDIARQPSPNIDAAKSRKNVELATLFMAFAYEAVASEAKRSYEHSKQRLAEIADENLQLRNRITQTEVDLRKINNKKTEELNQIETLIEVLDDKYKSSLEETLERTRQSQTGGNEVTGAVAQRVEAELNRVKTNFYNDYNKTQKSVMSSMRGQYEEALNGVVFETSRQRGIVNALREERRLTGGSLETDLVEKKSLQQRIKRTEREVANVNKEIESYETNVKKLQDLREKVLKGEDTSMSASEVSEKLGDAMTQRDNAKRNARNVLSPKRIATLEKNKNRIQELDKSIVESQALIAPLVKNLELEEAKLAYIEKKGELYTAFVRHARTAERTNFDNADLRRSANDIMTGLTAQKGLLENWIVFETRSNQDVKQDCIAKQTELQNEAKTCEASFVGVVEEEKKQNLKSLEWFEKYLALNTKDNQYLPIALAKAAFMSVEGKKYSKVEEYLSKLVKDYPESSLAKQAEFTLGRAYAEQGNIASAAKSFNKVLAQSNDLLPSQLHYMVNMISNSNSNDNAMKLQVLEPIIERILVRNDVTLFIIQNALLAYGKAAYAAKEYDKAIEKMMKLINSAAWNKGRASVEAQLIVANSYKNKNDMQNAINSYDRLLKNRALSSLEQVQYRYELAEMNQRLGGRDNVEKAANLCELIMLSWLPITDDMDDSTKKERKEMERWFEDGWNKFVDLSARLGNTKRAQEAAEEYKKSYPAGKYVNSITNFPEVDPSLAIPTTSN